MSNSSLLALRGCVLRGTSRAVRVTSFLFPLAVSFLFACSSTVTGTGSSGGSGTSGSPSSEGTVTNGGTGSSSSSSSGTPAGDTSEYEALFGPPENTALTENAIGGLWAGQASSNDLRLKITASSITIAMKCRSSTIGTKVAAQVSGTSIRLVESQQIGAEYDPCSIKVRPLTIPKCASTSDYGCFAVEGSVLVFQSAPLFSAGGYTPGSEYTKLSD